MKKITMLVLALVMSIAMIGCQNDTATTEAVGAGSEAAQAAYQEMTGDELLKRNEGKEKDKVLIIDVRPEEEYNAGHIPHAINILSDDMEANLEKIAHFKDKPVITYCNTGKRSAEAAEILAANGFGEVYNAQGVKEYDYELVTYEDILGSELLERKNGDVVLVDYRRADAFAEGHIDGAINIELDTIQDNLDKLPKDKEILIYCNTGTKSAEAAKELSDLGYENVVNSIEGVKEYEFELVK